MARNNIRDVEYILKYIEIADCMYRVKFWIGVEFGCLIGLFFLAGIHPGFWIVSGVFWFAFVAAWLRLHQHKKLLDELDEILKG